MPFRRAIILLAIGLATLSAASLVGCSRGTDDLKRSDAVEQQREHRDKRGD